jgi:hypothetical protein
MSRKASSVMANMLPVSTTSVRPAFSMRPPA